MEMPVVSGRDPTKQLKNDRFLGDLYGTLRRSGIPDQQIKKKKGSDSSAAKTLLRNTYLNNIGYRLGLEGDEGTKNFLSGRSLAGDITSDHYTSFTDLDAVRRMLASQTGLQPLRKYEQTEIPREREDGCTEWTFLPDDTRQIVQVDMVIDLQPGEIITVACEHGTEAALRSRELKEDRTVKRKSGSRKKKTTTSILPSDALPDEPENGKKEMGQMVLEGF